MIRFTLALAIVLASSAALAAEKTLEDPPWVKSLIPREVVYRVPGMDRVRLVKDVVYKKTAGESLTMDLYQPGEAGTHPIIFFIHGGYLPPNLATKPKDWGVYKSYGRLAAASGFVGVTFNHRYYSFESMPDAQKDIDDAIAYVRQHASEYHADPDRVVLWAFSGGGAFLAAPIRSPQPFVRSLLAFYCIFDFEGAPGITDALVRDFSATVQLQNAASFHVPMLIARAGRDAASLLKGTDKFLTIATARNIPFVLMNHPQGQHGFDILDDDRTTRWIIGEALAFARECTSW